MTLHAVCPYYACNEDYCDVGCGYITSHDASMISRYCSSDYKACGKFRELLIRFDNDIDKIGEVRIPVALPERPAPLADKKNIALGLTGGGLSVLLYILYKSDLFGLDVRLAVLFLLATGSLQLSAGMVALKKKSIRGLMFIGGGLFWISMLALDILPAAGFGTSTSALPLSGYLVLWGFFGLIPIQAGVQVSRSCRNFYGLGALFLFLLAAAPFTPVYMTHITYSVGLATGCCGLWSGLEYILRKSGHTLKLDRKKAGT